MKKILALLGALALLAVPGSIVTVTTAVAAACPPTTMSGAPSPWTCSNDTLATTGGAPAVKIAPPSVVTPPVVTPPETPEPSEPNCTVIPGEPIYENQVIDYEDGKPIREKVAKYKTINTPFGSIEIFVGYEWVTTGYEQVPVYGDVIVDYTDPVEVCDEPSEEPAA